MAQQLQWSHQPLRSFERPSIEYAAPSFERGASEILGRLAGVKSAPVSAAFDSEGRVRFIAGFSAPHYSGDAEEVAFAFLGEFAPQLGLQEELRQSQLSVSQSTRLGDVTFLRLQQSVQGVPIAGADVVIALDADKTPYQVTLSHVRNARAVGEWLITANDALSAAQWVRPVHVRDETAIDRVWFAHADGNLQPAYRVRIPAQNPLGDWEYMIDARDGSLIAVADLLHRADGLAYNRNPVVDGREPSRVTLNHLSSTSLLTGQFAKVYSYLPNIYEFVAPDVASQLARADSNGDFLFPLTDPRFDEVQLYHALDRVHQRFNALGLKSLDRPLDAMVFWPPAIFEGPFYSSMGFGGRGAVYFAPIYPRLIDPAWDTDVIFHEYTHAVVNALVGPSRAPEFNALNEAYADYFSGSFHSDPKLAAFTANAFRSRFPYLRRLDNPNTYPNDLSPDDPHLSGLIWGGALWDVRNALGPDRADTVALLSLAGLSGSSGFFEAAVTAVSAAKMLYGPSVSDQVLGVMAHRGILTSTGLTAFFTQDLTPLTPVTGRAPTPSGAACVLDTPHEYRITLPPGTSALSVALVSKSNLQVFVRYRQPVVILSGVPAADYLTNIGTQVSGDVTLQSTPELQSGTYYLAVGNCNPFAVDYAIGVTYDGGSFGGPPAVTTLSSGVASSGSMPAAAVNSRQFKIQVPVGATSLKVVAQGSTDIDLYVRYNNPVSKGPEGLPLADAYSESLSSTETINISNLTTPNLRPGAYYVAVKNSDSSQMANFSVVASVSTASLSSTSVVALSTSDNVQVPLPAAENGYGVLASTQYRIQVPTTAMKLTIAASANADAVVFVRRGNPITIDNNGAAVRDYSFFPASQPRFDITQQSYPPLQSGVLYVAIASFSSSPASATLSISLSASSPNVPQITSGGIVNAASYSTGVAPGSIISIFGRNLAGSPGGITSLPLPTALNGTSVTVTGVACPLFFVSPNQINAQLPFEVRPGPATMTVRTSDGMQTAVFEVSNVAPGIFTTDGVTAAANVADNVIVAYLTGQGQVSPRLPSGVSAPTDTFYYPTGYVSATLNGIPARILFAGLAPGFVGLLQINMEPPQGLPSGRVPLLVTISGKTSNSATIIR